MKLPALAFAALALSIPALAELPPLIDRELLFGEPEISGAQISPNGAFVTFQKPLNGTRNIWIKKTAEPFSSARVLTAETKRPISGYFWSRDSKRILFVKDNDGDENFNVFSVDPMASPAAGSSAPPAQDLTGLKGVRVMIYAVPKSQPGVIYLGLNDRDKAWHDLYKLDLATGKRTLVRQNSERIAAWHFDVAGNLRLASRVEQNGDQETLRVDGDKFTRLHACGVFDSCGPIRFHKDGKRVYYLDNSSDDLIGLFLMDVATGKLEKVHSDPDARVDFSQAIFSDSTDELVATAYIEDQPRVYFTNKSWEADYNWLKGKMPGYEIGLGSATSDENLRIVSFMSDTEPGQNFLFDRKGRKLDFQYKVREKLDRAALSPVKTVRYKSSDGLEIPAYLTLPKGLPAKGLPTVVLPHGGPWSRDMWGYSGFAQFLANRGYAVLRPNFRGSVGFGKKFLNAGNGEWGKKMQDDITWGVKHLVAEGIADPKRVAIMGGSYGGYATLAGVTFTPDLYRAGVDIVGPSNLITLLDAVPPYWEAMKKVLHSRMADPATEEGKAWLRERSPLNFAAKIKTPLMVVQGANDPRVNVREAEQIVVALRDRKFPVEYLLADDEGHGFARPVNNLAMMMAIEEFLAKQIDGRYQQGGSPESVKRLAELRVDPATVKLPEALSSQSSSDPKPVHPPVTGTLRYQVQLKAGEREMKMDLERQVTAGPGGWLVKDIMKTPMGEATDSVTLEAESLNLRKRSAQQGPVVVEFSHADGKVAGSMTMNGQQQKIAAETGGLLFADGPSTAVSIGTLPLKPGYTASFQNFDVMTQKTRTVSITSKDPEKVTVPAGEFMAHRVEIDTGTAKATVWIDTVSRKPLKTTAAMPQMGGAMMTAELLP